jgi:hypothetical protein
MEDTESGMNAGRRLPSILYNKDNDIREGVQDPRIDVGHCEPP